ncbi:MAG: magnesium transporter [Acidimicrobiia bacterium]|nr:magnesium transporter [Acidimicrobiia bacterium]
MARPVTQQLSPRMLARRARALLGPDPAAARQSLVALLIGLVASLVAGLTLGGISDTIERLPGLLVLVPAAIALRGTIFGALGSRLGTAIHAGTYRFTRRPDSVLGQNVMAAGVLTFFTSVTLAVLAKVISEVFGIANAISLVDFMAISFIGGVLSSIVVLALTVFLAESSVRSGWDLDNVMAPLVTASGDMVTLPALFVATLLIGIPGLSVSVSVVATLLAAAALVAAFRSNHRELRAILREALWVVVAAGVLSLVAGLTLERQVESLITYPALLALVPPFLASAGALGGIVSSRMTSKLHLGVVEPDAVPGPVARVDLALAMVLALPVFALASLVADLAALLIDLESPGVVAMLAVAMVGGMFATVLSMLVAYYGAIVSYRLGLDPDNLGIPLVTSSIDLLGSFSFIAAVVVFV